MLICILGSNTSNQEALHLQLSLEEEDSVLDPVSILRFQIVLADHTASDYCDKEDRSSGLVHFGSSETASTY